MHFLLIQRLWKPLPFNQGLPFIPNSQISLNFKMRWATLTQTHFEMESSFMGNSWDFKDRTVWRNNPMLSLDHKGEFLHCTLFGGCIWSDKERKKESALLELEWAHRKSKDHGMTKELEEIFASLGKAWHCWVTNCLIRRVWGRTGGRVLNLSRTMMGEVTVVVSLLFFFVNLFSFFKLFLI